MTYEYSGWIEVTADRRDPGSIREAFAALFGACDMEDVLAAMERECVRISWPGPVRYRGKLIQQNTRMRGHEDEVYISMQVCVRAEDDDDAEGKAGDLMYDCLGASWDFDIEEVEGVAE